MAVMVIGGGDGAGVLKRPPGRVNLPSCTLGTALGTFLGTHVLSSIVDKHKAAEDQQLSFLRILTLRMLEGGISSDSGGGSGSSSTRRAHISGLKASIISTQWRVRRTAAFQKRIFSSQYSDRRNEQSVANELPFQHAASTRSPSHSKQHFGNLHFGDSVVPTVSHRGYSSSVSANIGMTKSALRLQ